VHERVGVGPVQPGGQLVRGYLAGIRGPGGHQPYRLGQRMRQPHGVSPVQVGASTVYERGRYRLEVLVVRGVPAECSRQIEREPDQAEPFRLPGPCAPR